MVDLPDHLDLKLARLCKRQRHIGPGRARVEGIDPARGFAGSRRARQHVQIQLLDKLGVVQRSIAGLKLCASHKSACHLAETARARLDGASPAAQSARIRVAAQRAKIQPCHAGRRFVDVPHAGVDLACVLQDVLG